jgi:hypothetical protein
MKEAKSLIIGFVLGAAFGACVASRLWSDHASALQVERDQYRKDLGILADKYNRLTGSSLRHFGNRIAVQYALDTNLVIYAVEAMNITRGGSQKFFADQPVRMEVKE